jgi:hypothetical protein
MSDIETKHGSYNGAGLTLIHDDGDQNYSVLFAKSNSNNLNKRFVWIFAGGKRNSGENAIQTAYREFVEEIFNVVVDIKIINEIIDIIISKTNLYPIDSKLSNTAIIPSYTFLQSSKAITIFVDVLHKYHIKSDVFPFGYNGLYNNKGEVNIFNFCSQRRYINDVASFEKNELVFITMIPLNNLLFSISKNNKYKEIYHYHCENLKIHVPSTIRYIKHFLDKLVIEKNPDKDIINEDESIVQLSNSFVTITIT